jgi:hypothetical protein
LPRAKVFSPHVIGISSGRRFNEYPEKLPYYNTERYSC